MTISEILQARMLVSDPSLAATAQIVDELAVTPPAQTQSSAAPIIIDIPALASTNQTPTEGYEVTVQNILKALNISDPKLEALRAALESLNDSLPTVKLESLAKLLPLKQETAEVQQENLPPPLLSDKMRPILIAITTELKKILESPEEVPIKENLSSSSNSSNSHVTKLFDLFKQIGSKASDTITTFEKDFVDLIKHQLQLFQQIGPKLENVVSTASTADGLTILLQTLARIDIKTAPKLALDQEFLKFIMQLQEELAKAQAGEEALHGNDSAIREVLSQALSTLTTKFQSKPDEAVSTPHLLLERANDSFTPSSQLSRQFRVFIKSIEAQIKTLLSSPESLINETIFPHGVERLVPSAPNTGYIPLLKNEGAELLVPDLKVPPRITVPDEPATKTLIKLLKKVEETDDSGLSEQDRQLREFAKTLIHDLEINAKSPQIRTEVLRKALVTIHQKFSDATLEPQVATLSTPEQSATQAIQNILKGQETLKLMNPLVEALGEPTFILFPAIVGGLLSKVEVTFFPKQTGDTKNEKQRSTTPDLFQRIHLSFTLPTLGKVSVDIAHRPKEILLNIGLEREEAVSFVKKRIEKLAALLRGIGFEHVQCLVHTNTREYARPVWLNEIVQREQISI